MTPSSLLLPLYYVSFEMFCRVNNARPTSSRGGGIVNKKERTMRLVRYVSQIQPSFENFGKGILVKQFWWTRTSCGYSFKAKEIYE